MTSPVQSRSPEFDARFRPVIPLTMHFLQVEYHIEFADFLVASDGCVENRATRTDRADFEPIR